jgi:hypothetical protein
MRAAVWVGSFVIGGAAALWCSLAPAGDVATFLLALLLFGVAVEVVVIALAIRDRLRAVEPYEPPTTVNVYVAPGGALYMDVRDGLYLDAPDEEIVEGYAREV